MNCCTNHEGTGRSAGTGVNPGESHWPTPSAGGGISLVFLFSASLPHLWLCLGTDSLPVSLSHLFSLLVSSSSSSLPGSLNTCQPPLLEITPLTTLSDDQGWEWYGGDDGRRETSHTVFPSCTVSAEIRPRRSQIRTGQKHQLMNIVRPVKKCPPRAQPLSSASPGNVCILLLACTFLASRMELVRVLLVSCSKNQSNSHWLLLDLSEAKPVF